MSLTSCPECRRQVSTKADMCPHCGYNIRREDMKLGVIGFMVIVIVILSVSSIVGFFFSN
ncbi:MAG: hypothetical protein H6751_00795 [Candidatus Omnitrophica bacterium]|nr:hypothetical protein [Candidatus Omnitrophota bacterium]MCB9781488.1 hypothetical protein [Candidatus Omnitrophota bacterium]